MSSSQQRAQQARETIERLKTEMRDRLKSGHELVATKEAELSEAKEIRAALIGEAIALGLSYSEIGEVFGMTRQRVAQLAPKDID